MTVCTSAMASAGDARVAFVRQECAASLDENARSVFAQLQSQVVDEAKSGGTPMLLSMLVCLSRMTAQERNSCMEWFVARAVQARGLGPWAPHEATKVGGQENHQQEAAPASASPRDDPTAATAGAAAAPPPALVAPVLPMEASGGASPEFVPPRGASIAHTLGHLASVSPASRAAIGRAGGVKALAHLLAQDTNAKSRVETVGAIFALVQGSPENQAALAQAGGAQALATVASDASAPMVAREQAACVLGALAKAHSPVVAAEGGVQALVHLLETGSPAACGFAVFALRHVAVNSPECQAVIVSAGSVPHVVGLLAEGTPEETRGYAAGLLSALVVGNEKARVAVAAVGGVQALATMLSGCAPCAGRRAASALASLAMASDRCRSAAVDAGAVPALVRMLAEPQTQAEASHALAGIALLHVRGQRTIVRTGGVAALLHVAKVGAAPARKSAAAALRSIADGSTDGRRAVDEAGGQPLALAKLLAAPVGVGEHADRQLPRCAPMARIDETEAVTTF